MSETEHKYGYKKDGTPKQKPGRKLGYKKPVKQEEPKEQA
jgi:hypothetical protein